MHPRKHLIEFLSNRHAGVSIVGALVLPVVIGTGALVGEFGLALSTKAHNQRVADLAAYSGALAYSKKNSETDMKAAVARIATLNGIAAKDVTPSIVTSPKTAGAKAVQIQITEAQPLFLAKVLNFKSSMNISTSAMAEVAAETQPGCMLALSTTDTGITLSGGTQISAPNCAVSSNNTITLPCGTKITTIGANYNSATDPSICPWQPTLVTPAGVNVVPKKTLTADPLAGNAAVAGAAERIKTVNTMVAPSAPTVAAGGDIEFAYDQTKTKNQATAAGCTASLADKLWTLNCGTKKTVNFGTLSLGGGITVDFNVNGAADVTYNFSGAIKNTGTKLTFGPGTYLVAKGITTGGGSTTTFGAGTFKVGQSDAGCSGGTKVSVCNTSTLTFGGPSTFELSAGFMNTGGSTMTLGAGTTNSFKLGPSSNGDAIIIGGGSRTIMGNATGELSRFEVVGHVNGGGGGSCLVIPAAAQHDIDGHFLASGNVLLGAGTYTIDGYFALGLSGGGGGADCNGTVSVTGIDVSLVLSGEHTPTSGSCKGYAFCIAAGYSGVKLQAPTTGNMAKLAVIGPQDAKITAGALFTEGGSTGVIAGAFYFPNGPLVMSGGANTSGLANGTCFHPIATRITLSGGTSQVSECFGGAPSGSGKVAIVQ